MTHSKFAFVASEAAILPASVELQLRVKHQNGPVMQHSHREDSNNYALPTEMDEVEYCSIEFDCIDLDHSVYVENVELACAAPVKESVLHSARISERVSGCWMC